MTIKNPPNQFINLMIHFQNLKYKCHESQMEYDRYHNMEVRSEKREAGGGSAGRVTGAA